MYPLKLIPAYKDYIWGGNRLEAVFGKHSGYRKTAESWELSCHKDGLSIIENGEFSGKTLLEIIEKIRNLLQEVVIIMENFLY